MHLVVFVWFFFFLALQAKRSCFMNLFFCSSCTQGHVYRQEGCVDLELVRTRMGREWEWAAFC